MSNCDTTTGVAYGVLQGNHVPMLDQEIFDNGTDETYEDWKAELRKQLELFLSDPDLPEYNEYDMRPRMDAMEEILMDALKGLDICRPVQLFEDCCQYTDFLNGEFDIDKIFEIVLDSESQYYECCEPEHTWKDGETYYRRGHLGGAALIWVVKSRYVTPCRTCSPCVMGAGDLCNSCAPEAANNIAYCPPPEDWVDDIDEDRKPYVIFHTDENGYPTEEIAWQRPSE